MGAARQGRPGFWGTFRSYLVAGAVTSALVGVLGLYPVLTVLMTFNPARAAAEGFSLAVYITAILHPLACFLGPLFAYIAYHDGRPRHSVAWLLVPLVVTIVFAGLVWFADDFCGGRVVC